MKNTKKLFCLLLALVMTLAMVACGGNTTTEPTEPVEQQTDASGERIYEGVKLVYWSNWEAVETQGLIITEAVNEFMEETGAIVDLQFKGRTGIKEGLIPALDADQQVDLFDGAGNKLACGDLGMIAKLNDTNTGDTLRASGDVVYAPVKYATPYMCKGITPETAKDESKISQAIAKMLEEDMTLRYENNPETKQMCMYLQ